MAATSPRPTPYSAAAMMTMPVNRNSNMRGSPTDRYSNAATATSDRETTSMRDGAGGIASWRSTRSGGVFRSCNNDGNANPISRTNALPLASSTGVSPGSGRSADMISASISDSAASAAKPTTLPSVTPIRPSRVSWISDTLMTKRCVAPRLFINATVSRRRCANRLADMATATALSNRLITAVSDRNRFARSAARKALSLLSSCVRMRSASGRPSSFMDSRKAATESSMPATSSEYRTRLPTPMSPVASMSSMLISRVGASDAKPID